MNTVFCTTKANDIFSYKDSHDRDYYVHYREGEGTAREQDLVYNALNAVKDNIPPDLDPDINGDGFVDCITFIVYGYVEGWNSILWPHKWSLFNHDVTINGKKVRYYAFQIDGRNTTNGLGVLAHETLHVVGFADLYRYTEKTVDPVGSWDIMSESKGQHPNAYTKVNVASWMNARAITESGKYTLNPITSSMNNSLFMDSPYGRDERIFVEYRKKAGTFENALADSGLLIYRTSDLSRGKGNSGADTPPKEGGTLDEVFLYQDESGPEKSVYKAGFKTYFGDTSNPASATCEGEKMGIFITDVGAAGDTISFYLGVWFCDGKLEAIVRNKINKPSGRLYRSDFVEITSLEIRGNNEEWRLDGIENLEELTSVNLSYMTIRGGIRCLNQLPKLVSLTISHCIIIGN